MDTSKYELELVERRSEISSRLRSIEGELETARSIDDDERAVEREGEEVLEAVGEAGLAELKAIEAALGRIASGTYGLCAKCGTPISEKRLQAVPQAALCMACVAENRGE